jgi:hypothetical protein
MALKKLILPVLDLQDSELFTKIKDGISNGKCRNDIEAIVFPVIDSLAITKNSFTPITHISFFISELIANNYNLSEKDILAGIECARITLERLEAALLKNNIDI